MSSSKLDWRCVEGGRSSEYEEKAKIEPKRDKLMRKPKKAKIEPKGAKLDEI